MRINHRSKVTWISWGLGLAALAILVVHQPARTILDWQGVLIVGGLLTIVTGVILNTRAQRRIHRQADELKLLSAISEATHSNLSASVLLSAVAEQVTSLFGADGFSIALYDANRRTIHFPLNIRQHQPDPQEPRQASSGLIDYVIQTRAPLLIEDRINERAQEMGLTPPAPPACSWMGVPLGTGDRTWGCMAVLSSESRRVFSPRDLRLLAMVAAQIEVALDNAQLSRAARDRSAQLATLHVTRDRMQVILDTMKEGVILIDGEGRICLANPRVRHLLDLDPAEIVGQAVSDLLEVPALCLAERLGFESGELLTLVRRANSGHWNGTPDGERKTIEILSAAQDRTLDRTLTPARDDSGAAAGLLMVFADVTEERALAQARQDLSSMIVHDLRGPLTAISASVKLLSEIAPEGDPLGRAIRQTTEASSRAMRKLLILVDSLLDVSKMESGAIALTREPVMLWRMCAAVLDEFMPVAQELDLLLKLDVADDLPLLDVDLDKIERVLLNLVDNAIKFTPSGGTVTVRATHSDPGSGFLRVEVADTGPGIPDEHKEQLFNRFAQLTGQRGRRRGTGLGLTFCKLAVEAHDGIIWIEDNPQGGAIFAFTLPVAVVDDRVLQRTG